MRSEIHKKKPEDLEESNIEKSITHSGTNGPNETPIGDWRGLSTYKCTNETYELLLGISQTTFTKKTFWIAHQKYADVSFHRWTIE